MEASGQIHVPAALPPGNPLDRRLGGPQSRPERGIEKNSQPLPGIEPRSSDPPAGSQSLYRLSYPSSYMFKNSFEIGDIYV
jgi:hypothetical protein